MRSQSRVRQYLLSNLVVAEYQPYSNPLEWMVASDNKETILPNVTDAINELAINMQKLADVIINPHVIRLMSKKWVSSIQA